MNQFAKNVIMAFLDDDNSTYLRNRLNAHFLEAEEVKEFLDTDFRRRFYNYAGRIERELKISDPMEGTTCNDQKNMYNIQFLRETVSDIEDNVMCDLTPIYKVSEKPQCNGRSSQGFSLQRKPIAANDILKSWKDNSAPIHQYRDDNQGDYKASDRNFNCDQCYKPFYDNNTYCASARSGPRYCGNSQTRYYEKEYKNTICTTKPADKRPCSDLYRRGINYAKGAQNAPQCKLSYSDSCAKREGLLGGRETVHKENLINSSSTLANILTSNEQRGTITYSDQSHVGTGDYYDRQFNTSYSRALNRDPQMHTLQPFGYSTPDTDNRLLSRRIFRRNELGVENGIPLYEQRLQRRNLDRDIGETFSDTQYDYKQRGHDMTDLYNRVGYKSYIADKSRDNLNINAEMLYGN